MYEVGEKSDLREWLDWRSTRKKRTRLWRGKMLYFYINFLEDYPLPAWGSHSIPYDL